MVGHYTQSAILRFIHDQVFILLNDIPDNCIVAKHAKGTSNINKGKYRSWTEYWKDNIKAPLAPPDNICPCCKRKIIESESNYFVVGHIYDVNTRKGYLCPVCNECNVKMKKWSFIVAKTFLQKRPKNL